MGVGGQCAGSCALRVWYDSDGEVAAAVAGVGVAGMNRPLTACHTAAAATWAGTTDTEGVGPEHGPPLQPHPAATAGARDRRAKGSDRVHHHER